MARFWLVCRWVGAVVIVLFVFSIVFGSGWCAASHPEYKSDRAAARAAQKTWAGHSRVTIDAAPGNDVDATIHIGSRRPAITRPAWTANYETCRDHFVYDMGQAPAGRCDHLVATPAAAKKPTPSARRSTSPPCPPCDEKR